MRRRGGRREEREKDDEPFVSSMPNNPKRPIPDLRNVVVTKGAANDVIDPSFSDDCSDEWWDDALADTVLRRAPPVHDRLVLTLFRGELKRKGNHVCDADGWQGPTERARKKKKKKKKSHVARNMTCPAFVSFRAAPYQVWALFLCSVAGCLTAPHDALLIVAEHRYPFVLRHATHVVRSVPTHHRHHHGDTTIETSITTMRVVDSLLPRIVKIVREIVVVSSPPDMYPTVYYRWGPFRWGIRDDWHRYEMQVGGGASPEWTDAEFDMLAKMGEAFAVGTQELKAMFRPTDFAWAF